MIPRWLHRAYAATLGYFWKPCPRCGVMFGGHETNFDKRPEPIKVPLIETTTLRWMTCRRCQREGVYDVVIP